MLRCFAIERRGNSVSLGEVRWAIATLRDLGRTSADRLYPRFPFRGEFCGQGMPTIRPSDEKRVFVTYRLRWGQDQEPEESPQ